MAPNSAHGASERTRSSYSFFCLRRRPQTEDHSRGRNSLTHLYEVKGKEEALFFFFQFLVFFTNFCFFRMRFPAKKKRFLLFHLHGRRLGDDSEKRRTTKESPSGQRTYGEYWTMASREPSPSAHDMESLTVLLTVRDHASVVCCPLSWPPSLPSLVFVFLQN